MPKKGKKYSRKEWEAIPAPPEQYTVFISYDWTDAKESDRRSVLVTEDKVEAITHATKLFAELHAGEDVRIHLNRTDERK